MKQKRNKKQQIRRNVSTPHNLKVTNDELLQLSKRGYSTQRMAEKLRVNPSTISRRLRKLKLEVVKSSITVPANADRIVNNEINAFEQIQKINKDANEMLDRLMAWQRGDPEAIRVLESQVKKVVSSSCETGQHEVTEIKFKDPHDLALKCMAEIRGQLDLQLKIMQALYDVKAGAEFQAEVLQTIGEVSPDIRDEIVNRLQKKRAVRQSVTFP